MAAIALVTGASGGIGEAIAHVLAREGEELVLVARSAERLAAVASAIASATGRRPTVIPLDLEQRGAVDAIRAKLAQEGLVVRHLVNNAGYGLAGDVAELPRDGQCGIVDLNVRALLDLTVAFLPEILRERGGVLNVASVAAYTPGPGLAVYYASKAFVLSFTRALAVETAGRGVRVSALCPGPTPTSFGTRAGFQGTRAAALIRPLSAERVAREGVAGYRRGRTVVIPGILNRLLVLALGIVPSAVVLPIVARIQRKRRAAGALP
jgi:short-subunit dehydrogenase